MPQTEQCPVPLIPVDPSLPRTGSYEHGAAVLRSTAFNSDIYDENAAILGGTLLASDGVRHRHLKRLEGVLFTPERLGQYEKHVLVPVIHGELAAAVEDGPQVDLLALARRMALAISARVVGLGDLDGPRLAELAEILGGMGDAILIQWSERDHGEVIDEALGYKARYWERFVGPALDAVRKRPGGDDLLSLIVADDELAWTDDEIAKEAILYLAAAAFTTATAVTHSTAELLDWLDTHPADRVRVGDLQFLRAAAMEALRVHPGRHVLIRRAVDATTMPDGTPVAAGGLVLVDCFRANMDRAAYGSNVESFDPHRVPADGALPYGLSFGAGRHGCLGRPLVLGLEAEDGSMVRDGTVAVLLHALFAAGLQRDPDHPPRRPASVHDRYESFPVLLTGSP